MLSMVENIMNRSQQIYVSSKALTVSSTVSWLLFHYLHLFFSGGSTIIGQAAELTMLGPRPERLPQRQVQACLQHLLQVLGKKKARSLIKGR